MAVDIKNLIAAISPDAFCDNTPDGSGKRLSEVVKKLAKDEGYLKAAGKAKLRESDYLDVIHARFTKGAFAKMGLKFPIEQHKLVYDALSQNLEQIYFWILDKASQDYGDVEKLIDNFISSPGSGHFMEMQQRATRMQEEAQKIFQTTGRVLIPSILNLIYDLKEFKLRLGHYDDLHSGDSRKKMAAVISLKQIWMDNVDIKRGNGSINAMAQQLDFVTLRDAFFAVENLEKVEKIDLNERVKRILMQRVSEFERWIVESEKELRKRYEVEKTYLLSQVNSLKLYAKWAKPYLKAAQQLEQTATADAGLVNVFNTSLFELTLLAKGKYDPKGDVANGELPKAFLNQKLRKYSPITVIEFKFRSIPERADQQGGYGFRGKVEIVFTSFALNEDELQVLKDEIEKDDFGDVYEMISGATETSLGAMKTDIDEILGEGLVGGEKKEEEKNESDVNPFSSLFEFAWAKREKKKDLSKGIPKDGDYEKVLRSQAILTARFKCRILYDDYKKAHGMPGFPPIVY